VTQLGFPHTLAQHQVGAILNAFEFFFSFYGLVLGLSVAVTATGLATAIQHRKKIQIGWLTPLLALFVCLDIASFWTNAWVTLQHLPVSYGLFAASMVVALTYFIACSLVFPHQIEDGDRLDDHFWANKRIVLGLMIVATVLGCVINIVGNLGDAARRIHVFDQVISIFIYCLLIAPAALTRRKWLFAALIGLHMFLYVVEGAVTAFLPEPQVLGDAAPISPNPASDGGARNSQPLA